MDVPRVSTPSAIRIYDQVSVAEQRSNSESPDHMSSSPIPSKGAMPIPNALLDDVPPPLPPPRFTPSLVHGHDPGWNFANAGTSGGPPKSMLAPIRQGSSLCGGYIDQRLNTKVRSKGQQSEDKKGQVINRKNDQLSKSGPVSQSDILPGEEDRAETASPSSIANQR